MLDTFKKLRKSIFAAWSLPLIVLLLCSLFLGLSYWWMVAYIAFPFVLLFFAAFIICIFTVIGDQIKAKNPPCCENCIWSKARGIAGSCMGEHKGYTYGTVCDEYEMEE